MEMEMSYNFNDADQREAAMAAKWAEACDEIESLRQQLSAALAAIKVKDESLEAAYNGLRWWMDAFPLHVTEADDEEMLKLVTALAIQPDDAALKAWLGEPEWFYRKNADGVNVFYEDIEERPHGCKPLYSPKELK